jgi:hypothetical protein
MKNRIAKSESQFAFFFSSRFSLSSARFLKVGKIDFSALLSPFDRRPLESFLGKLSRARWKIFLIFSFRLCWFARSVDEIESAFRFLSLRTMFSAVADDDEKTRLDRARFMCENSVFSSSLNLDHENFSRGFHEAGRVGGVRERQSHNLISEFDVRARKANGDCVVMSQACNITADCFVRLFRLKA